MALTPECKKCGNRHLNFKACPRVFGSASSVSVPPGFKLVEAGDSHATLHPLPPGLRFWHQGGGPVTTNDPPEAA